MCKSRTTVLSSGNDRTDHRSTTLPRVAHPEREGELIVTTAVYEFYTDPDGAGFTTQNFEVFSYPMGDTTVRLVPNETPWYGAAQLLLVRGASVDWSIVKAWSDLAVNLFGDSPRILALPYLPSARGDKDTPSPARVNAKMCAETGITDLITIDPHSGVWLDALKEYSSSITVHEMDTARVLVEALHPHDGYRDPVDYAGVIAPDHGALGRAGAVAELLDIPLYTAEKKRDAETGRLLSYHLGDLGDANGEYLIVDDICDGGGTFALLAQSAPETVKLDLWVTHGGFTKGIEDTGLDRYRTIYTTDSLPTAQQAADKGGRRHDKDLIEVVPLRFRIFAMSSNISGGGLDYGGLYEPYTNPVSAYLKQPNVGTHDEVEGRS